MMRPRRGVPVFAVLVLGLLAPAATTAAASPTPVPRVAAVVQTSGSAGPEAAFLLGGQAEVAQIVDVSPSAEGMPGADLIRRLLSWLLQLALWGSLASILAGATVYGISQNSASYNGAYRGKQLAVAGGIGAALAGLAPTAITMLFKAAGG